MNKMIFVVSTILQTFFVVILIVVTTPVVLPTILILEALGIIEKER